MYGTLDISRIDELPAGRKPVDTFVVDERYRERVNGFIEKQVSEGHQVYVVCPAIEDREDKKEKIPGNEESSDILLFDDFDDDQQLPLKKATEYAENLKSNFPHLTVSLVHGKMKSYEREKIMASYCRGEIQVLVSTTVIEVGVNVPNATLMIVENAERFGLSQLHQLRGRVGRGDAKSYFILVSDAKGEKARERLLTIKKCRNGYDIAEADLRLRGPGDIFSANGITRQHGESSLTLAANCTDLELISSASHIAEQILAEDPLLEKDEHYHIRKLCERFMENTAGYMN
jgi:ATP-dependent DNA helicase RecG